jgi:hypothetical protein
MFLSPKGMVFFLPAFMTMVLEPPEKDLVWELYPAMKELIDEGGHLAVLVSADQRTTIHAFLEFIAEECEMEGSDHPVNRDINELKAHFS